MADIGKKRNFTRLLKMPKPAKPASARRVRLTPWLLQMRRSEMKINRRRTSSKHRSQSTRMSINSTSI